MILLIDNYDSFTYNLAQLIEKEHPVCIARNDDKTLMELAEAAQAIVLSPGPGRPEAAGHMEAVIRRYYKTKPILGICLGHQAIAQVFGATIHSSQVVRHGKQSSVKIEKKSRLFYKVDTETEVMRYHSLVVDPLTLPIEIQVVAKATDDQEIMAIEHTHYPVYGLQFHPESIATPEGYKCIQNFIQIMEETSYGSAI